MTFETSTRPLSPRPSPASSVTLPRASASTAPRDTSCVGRKMCPLFVLRWSTNVSSSPLAMIEGDALDMAKLYNSCRSILTHQHQGGPSIRPGQNRIAIAVAGAHLLESFCAMSSNHERSYQLPGNPMQMTVDLDLLARVLRLYINIVPGHGPCLHLGGRSASSVPGGFRAHGLPGSIPLEFGHNLGSLADSHHRRTRRWTLPFGFFGCIPAFA